MNHRITSKRRTKIAVAIASMVAMTTMVTTAVVFAKPKKGDVLTVRVIRAKVMKKPRFIGGVAKDLSRGSKLKFVKAKGQWYQVSGAADGWIHKGQVAEGDVKMSSQEGSSGSSASREEVELAGRGFTPQVEDKYKKKNPDLDFSHVDGIEKAQPDPEAIEQFAVAGQLSAGAN